MRIATLKVYVQNAIDGLLDKCQATFICELIIPLHSVLRGVGGLIVVGR